MRKLFLIIMFGVMVLTPMVVSAVDIDTDGTPISLLDIERLISNVVQFIITIAGFVMLGAFVYAGVLMTTSGSDSKRYKEGQTILRQAAIGSLIILGTGVILATISSFTRSPTGIIN